MFPEIVPTVRARSRYFIRGLDPILRKQVNLVPLENFDEVLETARRAEICELNIGRERKCGKALTQGISSYFGSFASHNPPALGSRQQTIHSGRKSWALGAISKSPL